MHEIMDTWQPHTLYHAAAYKHVPLVEHNPAEGLRNNVWGTLVCAQAAARNGVQNFVLISTDKAVRPTNVMGATKRMAELVVQDMQTRTQKTNFAMVRFGNVLGSSGSVLPLFQAQINAGGPVTVTHEDVTRFFMTIPEAARLVLLAGAYATGEPIRGLAEAASDPDVEIFHAGARLVGGEVVSNGGRVLNVTARGATLQIARDKAYAAVARIDSPRPDGRASGSVPGSKLSRFRSLPSRPSGCAIPTVAASW